MNEKLFEKNNIVNQGKTIWMGFEECGPIWMGFDFLELTEK